MRKRMAALCLTCCMAMGSLSAFSACGNVGPYNVTYDLNFGTGNIKSYVVEGGSILYNAELSREGYDFGGWYTDSECTKEYDFTSGISKDITLYAKWTPVAARCVVTFDFNYGANKKETVAIAKNDTIGQSAPSSPRIGKKVVGWYRDEECTNEWNTQNSPVTESMTLYAKYEADRSVKVDENGDLMFENVEVNFYIGTDFGMKKALDDLVATFNAEHEGSIKVNTSTNVSAQADFSLRFQQVPAVNKTAAEEYYLIEDVYDLAGLTYNESDYYERATRDSHIGGVSYTVLIAAGVPFFVYNKSLMQRYSNGSMPSNYSELLALAQTAYKGELAGKANFKSLITTDFWAYKEAPSYAAFLQSGADYYFAENGHYKNLWDDADTCADAYTAFTNTYNLFGAAGSAHGGLVSSGNDASVINQVSSGNALMGMVCFPGYYASVAGNASLGVLPLSGLFTDKAGDTAALIPVHSVGFQFYRARSVTNTQLAAAAIVADYISKHSAAIGSAGWYPIRKEATESDEFQKSENAVVKLLKSVGQPENFSSFEGYELGKTIFNTYAAESVIVPVLHSNGALLDEQFKRLKLLIQSAIVN